MLLDTGNTAQQAAKYLGLSARYIYSLAEQQAIAHKKHGRAVRFDKVHILEYEQSCQFTTTKRREPTVSRLNVKLEGGKSELQNFFQKVLHEKKQTRLM